jgi:hypothetical protein
MTQIMVPLVGMHFRPPAKLILECLPSGTPLALLPEPENPYDEKAIRVLVSPDEVPASKNEHLQEVLPGMGHEWELVMAGRHEGAVNGKVFLGYIADSQGKECLKNGWNGNADVAALAEKAGKPVTELSARLTFSPEGKPFVHVSDEP